jgi:integrase
MEGKQVWKGLYAESFAQAKKEASQLSESAGIAAEPQGFAAIQPEMPRTANRIPLATAVDTYLEQKSGKSQKTIYQYKRTLNEFFLGSGCRDKEVTFAAWNDIDFDKKTYHVRRKEDVGFTPKSHESRTIPLPDSLIALLRTRRKKAPHERLLFINEEGHSDNPFLRKLKRIAKRAGLNCGQCRTVITEGRYEKRKKVEVSCKDRPVCEHFYLHRFRKTCATRWHEAGVPIRTIQNWLGHKSLETTMIYLGVTDSEKLRSNINAAFFD